MNNKNSNIWDEVQGARSAETRMYVVVHEDFEHRETQKFAQRLDFAK